MSEDVQSADALSAAGSRKGSEAEIVQVTIGKDIPVTTTSIALPAAATLPALVVHPSAAHYQAHFEAAYCVSPVVTFDGIPVRFRKRDFDHCCFESSKRDGNKDTFSRARAERIDWIRYALQLPSAELFVGWDNKRGRYDPDRRVTIIENSFVTVIQILSNGRANFVTAYRSDNRRTILAIRRGPKWT